MNSTLLVILVQACTGLAIWAIQAGNAYLNGSEGLHPIIAGALALWLFLLPHVTNAWVEVRREAEDE